MEMNKKLAFIIGGVAVAIIIVLLVIFLKSGTSTPSDGFSIKVSPPVPTVTVPKQDLITINTNQGPVQVKNFYKAAKFTVAPSVYLDDNKQFSIIYSESTKDFSIDLYAYDTPTANTIRKSAEDRLLVLLDITKDQACRLGVDVEVPFSYNQDLSGKNYGLSFCPGAKPVSDPTPSK